VESSWSLVLVLVIWLSILSGYLMAMFVVMRVMLSHKKQGLLNVMP
jgi:uncharacterized integral membrane protein